MKHSIFRAAIGLMLFAGAADAAGPLYTTDSSPPRPYQWDTSHGAIPVWTDGGGAFTYNFDGVTPFITLARANEITEFAFNEWSKVPTSTLRAHVAGTIAQQTGIADVTGANADQFYGVENGYGFWVLYDTDGSILEDYFGVPRSAVLGISFPEWADDNGLISEATTVLNGWNVHVSDTQGNKVAGVFTHEIGHALNLSHTQVNGQLAYYSYTYAPLYPGVKGCVNPVYRWDYSTAVAGRIDPRLIETMYPYINHVTSRAGDGLSAGQEQSTVDRPDDIAAISNLYPTPDYLASRGTISGVLRLKDGRTPYSGINLVARNVANPLGDAVSAMSGDQTQGKVGPDGRFTINNLTPGQDYQLYIEEIYAGGYPTAPRALVSQAEYWDAAEGSNPATDLPCNATAIRAEAGVEKVADITFNGYMRGVEFTPIVSAHLTDLAKNGRSAAGQLATTAFTWDLSQGFTVLPASLPANNGSMTRNGQWMTVAVDPDHDGIFQAALWSPVGKVISMGDLNGDTCGGSASYGKASSYGWAVSDDGNTAVGTAYVDRDGNGRCESSGKSEILPFIWHSQGGLRALDTSSLSMSTLPWVRAHAVSGNGEVVLGTANLQYAYAWVKDGPAIDLTALYGAQPSYASSYDGHRVALPLRDKVTGREKGIALWDHATGALTPIGSLKWCRDIPYTSFFGGNLCNTMTSEQIEAQVGTPRVEAFDMSDDGSILIGRAGSFFTGVVGAVWIEQVGWMTWESFLRKQGVVEASNVPFSNPISISGTGREVVGGIPGVTASWLVNIDQVFVCENGTSVQTGYPNGLRAKIAAGAQFGRCEHLGN